MDLGKKFASCFLSALLVFSFSFALPSLAYAGNEEPNPPTVDPDDPNGPTINVLQTIKYVAGNGGTIQGDATQKLKPGDHTTAVTATPGNGYSFLMWSDGYANATRTDLVGNEDKTLTAEFSRDVQSPSVGWSDVDTCEWSLDSKTHTLTVRPIGNADIGVLGYSNPWKTVNSVIDRVVFEGKIKLSRASASFMFSSMDNLLEIKGAGNLDVSGITDLSCMFYGCPSLERIDLRGACTFNATNMSSMFSDCSSLRCLDLSDFDTSNVTNMSYMFSGCSVLGSVSVSRFDTSRALNMSGMFQDCRSLKSLDLSRFATTRVKDMSSMFSGCASLASLDVSSFDTRRVEYGCSAFYKCSSLHSIKVGKDFTLQSELPKGTWKDSRGYSYSHTIPSGVPGVFTYYGSVPSVTISSSCKTLRLSDEQFTLTAKANSDDWWGSIKWASSNPLVASVDSRGVVTPQGIGVAVITASADRAIATCKITVVPSGASASKLVKSKRSFTIKWTQPVSKSLKQITGYKIRYSTAKSMRASKTKTIKLASKAGKTRSLKVSKLKAKKKYYVQVATYKNVGSKTYQSAWSKAKTVKTK